MNIHNELRKLQSRLKDAIDSSLKDIKEHQDELDLIMSLDDKLLNNEFARAIIKDACEDAKATVADGKKLIEAAIILERIK